MVKVLNASVDVDLIGKILPIVKVDRVSDIGVRIWVEGSKSSWVGNYTDLDNYLQLVSSHISSVSDGASCTVSERPMFTLDPKSIVNLFMPEEIKLLNKHGAILSDGNLNVGSTIFKEAVYEVVKDKMVKIAKRRDEEAEKAAKK